MQRAQQFLLLSTLLRPLVGGSKLLWALVVGIVLRRLMLSNLAFRLAVNRLLRQPWTTLSQLAACSLSFILLALLLVMRGDLLDRWQ